MLTPAALADTALVADLRAMCLSAGQARFEKQIEALLARPEVDDLLPAITVPPSPSWANWTDGARLSSMSRSPRHPRRSAFDHRGAGHMLPAEDPDAFNAAIARFLG
jgi:pimeloyl-ACP methyl ester carboxylesterase